MPVTLDLSNDYAVFDGIATVTFYAAQIPELDGTGGVWTKSTAASIAGARIEKIEQREVEASAGVYTRCDTRIRLPFVFMNVAPKPGDMITDGDGNSWTVYAVGAPRFNNSWSCFCLALQIDGDLTDHVTWKQSHTFNFKGSREVSYTSAATHVHARIQPLTALEIDFQAKLGFDVNYAVYVTQDMAVKSGDLILDDTTDDVYEVKSWGSRKSLTDLASVFCKRRP
jgi:hypothetical protein